MYLIFQSLAFSVKGKVLLTVSSYALQVGAMCVEMIQMQ